MKTEPQNIEPQNVECRSGARGRLDVSSYTREFVSKWNPWRLNRRISNVEVERVDD